MLQVETVPTKPFEGQKTGTSGLRKQTAVFRQPHYLDNWIQALFNCLGSELNGTTLVLGGDGRFWNQEAIQIIIKLSFGNGVKKLIIGQDGILSTPAVSALIRKRNCFGGIILTASHNPGGPDNDFGIKYNVSNGGPAPESITNEIYKYTQSITELKQAVLPGLVDLNKLGTSTYGDREIEIVDSVDNYLELMKEIFDFDLLKKFLSRSDFKFVYDGMNGVTGPYLRRIFVQELGAPETSVMNATPLPDFGGHHPDPNLTYAAELVAKLQSGEYDFGAASDGDGDRNMILGKKFFVNPSDSLAVVAAQSHLIPFFQQLPLKAIARSMPTSQAADHVSQKLGVANYEVPTGWKFFGNLMEKYQSEGRVICGEESFGLGSNHIREKDGIWAVLMWLSILAQKNQNVPVGGKLIGASDIVHEHWVTYGRNFFSRYDYESVDSTQANKMMDHLMGLLTSLPKGSKVLDSDFALDYADDFSYNDPVDGSVTTGQGLRFVFTDGSRFVFRLSGTGSVGATIRLYAEKYTPSSAGEEALRQDTAVGLSPLLGLALKLSKIKEFIGTDQPTVIT